MERPRTPDTTEKAPRYEQCVFDSIASAASVVAGEDLEIPDGFREKREKQAIFVERRKSLGMETIRKLDERWIRRMIDDLRASETLIGEALRKMKIIYRYGDTAEVIDQHLEQGDQVIVAYGTHMDHIELSQDPRKYRSVIDGSEITKAEVIGRRPSYMIFNFVVFREANK